MATSGLDWVWVWPALTGFFFGGFPHIKITLNNKLQTSRQQDVGSVISRQKTEVTPFASKINVTVFSISDVGSDEGETTIRIVRRSRSRSVSR